MVQDLIMILLDAFLWRSSKHIQLAGDPEAHPELLPPTKQDGRVPHWGLQNVLQTNGGHHSGFTLGSNLWSWLPLL